MPKKINKTADFLVEILTEEMPPKNLQRVALHFLEEIKNNLTKANLTFTQAEYFATPRRLAVIVKNLLEKQPDSLVERKGPALDKAYDAAGHPTPACLGFARSCNAVPEKLIQIKTAQGAWVGYKQMLTGKSVKVLLPEIVQQALNALPIAKRMRWHQGEIEFVRPVHSVILLYGKQVISGKILGCKTGRQTQGHRFLYPKTISISEPSRYVKVLKKPGLVLVDFDERKNVIQKQIETLIKTTLGKSAQALISNDLLNEVTGLVEWPVAILGNFNKEFLTVPPEVLMSAMQDHQRYFPVLDKSKKLLPHFVTISNIQSKNKKSVIHGNERVLRARLSDAAFFFEQDKKIKLSDRLDTLKNIVYQARLGSLFDKAKRLEQLCGFLANALKVNPTEAKRAGLIAKTDLTSNMVGEFAELQGTMGYYYAKQDGEANDVAVALKEQYLPRFAKDQLPHSALGCVLALADKIDVLVGVFGINQPPTGDKDPFGLRRAALGILRILIEKKLNLDLKETLQFAVKCYTQPLENSKVVEQVLDFIQDRLKPWYQEQNISADIFAAVSALAITKPYDFHQRMQAVTHFKKLAGAESLSIANKRVSNILSQYNNPIEAKEINPHLFEENAERELAKQLEQQAQKINNLLHSAHYAEALTELANLRQPVDHFFDKVLVMTEDKSRRENRLLLLKKLRELFLQVADIALLQSRDNLA